LKNIALDIYTKISAIKLRETFFYLFSGSSKPSEQSDEEALQRPRAGHLARVVCCHLLLRPDHPLVLQTAHVHHRMGRQLETIDGSWNDIRCQFHKHFTRSFYACRSQRRKKRLFFALLGSACVKAAHNMLMI